MQQTRGNMRTVQAGQGQQIAGAHQQIAAGEPVAAIGIGRGAHEGQHCRTGQQVDRRARCSQQKLLQVRHRQAAQPQAEAEGRDLDFRPALPQKAVSQRVAALMQHGAAQPYPQDAAAVKRQQQR